MKKIFAAITGVAGFVCESAWRLVTGYAESKNSVNQYFM